MNFILSSKPQKPTFQDCVHRGLIPVSAPNCSPIPPEFFTGPPPRFASKPSLWLAVPPVLSSLSKHQGIFSSVKISLLPPAELIPICLDPTERCPFPQISCPMPEHTWEKGQSPFSEAAARMATLHLFIKGHCRLGFRSTITFFIPPCCCFLSESFEGRSSSAKPADGSYSPDSMKRN